VSDHVIKYVTRLVAPPAANTPTPRKSPRRTSAPGRPASRQYLILAPKAMPSSKAASRELRRHPPRCAAVLRHRILTNFAADSEGLTPSRIIKKLIEQVPEPGAEAYAAPKAM